MLLGNPLPQRWIWASTMRITHPFVVGPRVSAFAKALPAEAEPHPHGDARFDVEPVLPPIGESFAFEVEPIPHVGGGDLDAHVSQVESRPASYPLLVIEELIVRIATVGAVVGVVVRVEADE